MQPPHPAARRCIFVAGAWPAYSTAIDGAAAETFSNRAVERPPTGDTTMIKTLTTAALALAATALLAAPASAATEMNGFVLNGVNFNGLRSNGFVLNGFVLNGRSTRGAEVMPTEAADVAPVVKAVRLPAGKRLTNR
jgi:hypothetical protein